MIPIKKLGAVKYADVNFKDKSSVYEEALLRQTFTSGFTYADSDSLYDFEGKLASLADVISDLFDHSPEECVQDIKDARDALGRAWDKFQTGKENSI